MMEYIFIGYSQITTHMCTWPHCEFIHSITAFDRGQEGWLVQLVTSSYLEDSVYSFFGQENKGLRLILKEDQGISKSLSSVGKLTVILS